MNAVDTATLGHALEEHWRVATSALLALSGALNALTGAVLWATDTVMPGNLPIVEVFQLTNALRIEQQIAAGGAGGWGWFLVLVGLTAIAAAVGVLRRHFLGAAVGIVFVALGLFGSLALLPAYFPLTLVMLAVEVLVLYALIVYGSRFA
jgi:hypothetical protein